MELILDIFNIQQDNYVYITVDWIDSSEDDYSKYMGKPTINNEVQKISFDEVNQSTELLVAIAKNAEVNILVLAKQLLEKLKYCMQITD